MSIKMKCPAAKSEGCKLGCPHLEEHDRDYNCENVCASVPSVTHCVPVGTRPPSGNCPYCGTHIKADQLVKEKK